MRSPIAMQRLSWVWIAGCLAWILDGLLQLRLHAWPHAELAFLIAAMFAGAWLFYSRQPKR